MPEKPGVEHVCCEQCTLASELITIIEELDEINECCDCEIESMYTRVAHLNEWLNEREIDRLQREGE